MSIVHVDRLCLFAHFDSTKSVADHVIYYLTALKECGFSTVVISNGDLSQEARARLSSVTIDVIVRTGYGLDFASWAVALKQYRPTQNGLLLLVNDSVYGPIGDLSAALKHLMSIPADVYGMVESEEVSTHLQSWFLLISPVMHQQKAFEKFFAQDFQSMSKPDVITHGEIGFSALCRELGVQLHALYRSNIPEKLRGKFAFNPMFTTWQEIICEKQVPFIKRQVLRNNPWSVPHFNQWRTVVVQRAPTLVPMIEAYIKQEKKTATKGVPLYFKNLLNKLSLNKICRFAKERAVFHGFVRSALLWQRLGNIIKFHKIGRMRAN